MRGKRRTPPSSCCGLSAEKLMSTPWRALSLRSARTATLWRVSGSSDPSRIQMVFQTPHGKVVSRQLGSISTTTHLTERGEASKDDLDRRGGIVSRQGGSSGARHGRRSTRTRRSRPRWPLLNGLAIHTQKV